MAKYLDKTFHRLRDRQTIEEFAKALWIHNPKDISRYRTGEWKFPLDMIFLLAPTIPVNPGHLYRLAFDQHWPDLQVAIAEIFGEIATSTEGFILEKWREATDNMDPFITEDIKLVIAKMAAEVKAILQV